MAFFEDDNSDQWRRIYVLKVYQWDLLRTRLLVPTYVLTSVFNIKFISLNISYRYNYFVRVTLLQL